MNELSDFGTFWGVVGILVFGSFLGLSVLHRQSTQPVETAEEIKNRQDSQRISMTAWLVYGDPEIFGDGQYVVVRFRKEDCLVYNSDFPGCFRHPKGKDCFFALVVWSDHPDYEHFRQLRDGHVVKFRARKRNEYAVRGSLSYYLSLQSYYMSA